MYGSVWADGLRKANATVCDPATKEFKVETLSSEATWPEYDNLTVEEVMVKSHDGVEVPLSLIYDKNVKKDGNAPVLILAMVRTEFQSIHSSVLRSCCGSAKGGVLADRAYSWWRRTWRRMAQGGTKTTKPNTWKDLIACAEHLVSNQYTSPKEDCD